MPKESSEIMTAEETIKVLNGNFDKLGLSKTRLSRWNLTKAKHVPRVKGYIEKIGEAGYLDKASIAVNNSRNKTRNAKRAEASAESSLIEKTFKGVSSLFYLTVMPVWDAFAELLYYRRRPLYNAFRLGLSLLVMGGIIAAIVFFPPLIAPILLELTTLLGSFYLLGTGLTAIVGLLTFRLIFSATTALADRIDFKQGYYLPTSQVDLWLEKTNINEDTLKIMKQYLNNTAKQASDKFVKFTVTQLVENELTLPAEGNLKKLAIFFMHQLQDLRHEQAKRPQLQAEQLELDIKMVSFILDQFGYIELLPKVTREEIENVRANRPVHSLAPSFSSPRLSLQKESAVDTVEPPQPSPEPPKKSMFNKLFNK